jgi:TPR repeat protein
LYERACAEKEGAACGNLGELYRSGSGVPKDRVRAAELFERGCDLDQGESCYLLGRAYQNGEGVERDEAQAVTLFTRAVALDPEQKKAARALARSTASR